MTVMKERILAHLTSLRFISLARKVKPYERGNGLPRKSQDFLCILLNCGGHDAFKDGRRKEV